MSIRCGDNSGEEASDTRHKPLKSLSNKTCLKCNKHDGVVKCSSDGCPIVVHKDCLPCSARFDDGGAFYCPYCVYKLAVIECQKAKECALLAKKGLVSFLDSKAGGSTEDAQIGRSCKRKKPEGGDFTLQDESRRAGLGVELDNPKKSDGIGEMHSGIVDEGTMGGKTLNNDSLHPLMGDFVPVELSSRSLDRKRRKTEKALEGSCDVDVLSKQRDLDKTTVALGRNEAFKIIEDLDEINATALQEEYASSSQLKVGSENGDQSAEIQKDKCDHMKNLGQSPKKAVGLTRKHRWTKDTEEVHHEGLEENEQELAEDAVYLTRDDNVTVLKESSATRESKNLMDHQEAGKKVDRDRGLESNEGNGCAFEDDNHFSKPSETAYKSNESEDHHEKTDELQPTLKKPRNASHQMRNCDVSVRHTEAGNLATESQEKIDAVDGYYDGLSKEGTQRVPQEPVQETAEEGDEGAEELNYSVREDEDLARNHMTANKNSDQACDSADVHCSRADEGQNQANVQINDVTPTRKTKTPMSHEEFDYGDEIKSSQESHYMGYRLRSKRKKQISTHSEDDDQPSKSSRSSGSEFEEYEESEDYEEVTHVKSRKKGTVKQTQHAPVSLARRKKLPWTIEEEEMLKEGVDRFSLTAKKNISWMKILEFGSHIFDGTRTPDDLRDKWKRLLKKACANA